MAQITPQQAGGVNVVAFLDMLAWSEGTDNGKQRTKDRGYGALGQAAQDPRAIRRTRWRLDDHHRPQSSTRRRPAEIAVRRLLRVGIALDPFATDVEQ